MPLGRDSNGQLVPAFRPGSAQAVAVGAVAADSAAVAAGSRFVRLCATSDTYVAFSGDATSSSMLLPAGVVEYFAVDGGTVISALQVAEAGSLSIVEFS